jgi:hypothetical protein
MLDRERLYEVNEILHIVERDNLSKRDAQQLYEGQVVASLVDTLSHLDPDNQMGNSHIRLMHPWERAPDVQLVGRDGKAQDVEVVTFTRYSENEGLMQFFKRTKLSPVYSYPAGTIIVCHVGIPLKEPARVGANISRALMERGRVRHEMFILCDNLPEDFVYSARIYPDYQEYWGRKNAG